MAEPPPIDGCLEFEGRSRCCWCGETPDYVRYHDVEWGLPVTDDRTLFEKICLEGFQAGLSWLTVLRKRPAFRRAFHQFELERVARMQRRSVDRLVQDAAIIRHRGKIESTLNNARRALEMRDSYGSLHGFFVRFRPKRHPPLRKFADIRSTSPESTTMSKELKRLGWSFVGPTTCYAFMQAMGLVNDHFVACHRWQEVQQAQENANHSGTSGK